MIKKTITALVIALAGPVFAASAFAQDMPTKMKQDKMMAKHAEQMKQSPQHRMMMVYRQSLLGAAKVLYLSARSSDPLGAEFARAAVTEIKGSFEGMEKMHRIHMAGMPAEMRDKMAKMMEKEKAQSARLSFHIEKLEAAVAGTPPNSAVIEAHTAALVMRLSQKKGGTKKKVVLRKMKKKPAVKRKVMKKLTM